MKNKRYLKILDKLNYLDKVIRDNNRDSTPFIKASNQSDKLLFSNVPPQDYGLIAKGLGRKLTNQDFAKIIITTQEHKSILSPFTLPASIAMTYELRLCQRETGLTQSEFAKRYHIPQPKLSKMEAGYQQVDVNDFQRILRSLNHKFMIT